MWKKYVAYRENRAGAPVRRTFFRHKKYGWKTYAVLFEFSNNTAYEQILSKDLFMQLFLSNVCLRPSCYQCKYKKLNRISDITLADFWGVPDICPELDDNKGTSVCFLHSQKAEKLFADIMPQLKTRKIDYKKGMYGNPSMVTSATVPARRDKFFADLNTKPFAQIGYVYTSKNIPYRVINKIKRLLGV